MKPKQITSLVACGMLAGSAYAQQAELSAISSALFPNGKSCDTPKATIEIRRGTLVNYACAHSCYDLTVSAQAIDLDFSSARATAVPSNREQAMVIVSCKAGVECVTLQSGQTGEGTRSCTTGSGGRPSEKQSQLNLIVRDSRADAVVESFKRIRVP